MSTPILFGSPRAQKNYIRPRFEGLAPRTTPIGYNKDQSVDRYVIPPPPPVYPYYSGSLGYFTAGTGGGGASSYPTNIDRVEVSSDAITSWGTLDYGITRSVSTFSSVDTYVISGGNPNLFPTQSIWQKYSYASAAIATLPPFNHRMNDQARGATNISSTVNGYVDVSSIISNTQSPVGIPQIPFISAERHAFASDVWTNGGRTSLTPAGYSLRAHGFHSTDYGYAAGGENYGPGSTPLFSRNSIRRFPFANDDNYTNLVTSLSSLTEGAVGLSDGEAGYSLGGTFPNGVSPPGNPITAAKNSMERFPFASENESVVVFSSLDTFGTDRSAFNAGTHGYADTSSSVTGDVTSPLYRTNIDKYSWGSNTIQTDIGAMSTNSFVTGSGSQSS